MEIERKFLIKEKEKNYSKEFNTEELIKEILKEGEKVEQNYLKKKYLEKIKEDFKIKIDFKINQIRTRKIGEKYFLTLKSKGILSREEFEIPINKESYEKYKKFTKKSIKKYRLEKIVRGKKYFFDYYEELKLVILEIEFKSEKEAKKFKIKEKEITKIKKYGNKNLARKVL
jgi:adenylate cyclase